MLEFLARVWYELMFWALATAYLLAYRVRSRGGRRVPRRGGVLLIANHQSFLDPALIGLVVRRRLTYLARKTLFRSSLFAWFIRSVGAVPVDHESAGIEGMKTALSQLKAGRAVLIFPEGTRTRGGAVQRLRPGVVTLIRRAGVPVLPVGVAGAFEAWPPQSRLPRTASVFLQADRGGMAVVVGNPIDSRALAQLPPARMLERLHDVLRHLHQQAEMLRKGSPSPRDPP